MVVECIVCRAEFRPTEPGEVICDSHCALQYARQWCDPNCPRCLETARYITEPAT